MKIDIRDLESQLLGAILLDESIISKLDYQLQPKHFALPLHQKIFEVIKELHQNNEIVDAITVNRELNKQNIFELPYLNNIVEIPGASISFAPLSTDIVEHAGNRSLEGISHQIARISNDEQSPLIEKIAMAHKLVSSVDISLPCTANMAETVEHFLQDREIRKEQGSDLLYIPTGIPQLDLITGGFTQRSMTCIGATYGTGKTFLSLLIAINLAKQGKSVLYFSLEMNNVELMARFLPMLNSPADIDPISRHETQSATIHPAKEIKLQQLLEEAKSLPIIFDWGTKDFEDIIAIVNNLKAKKQADIVFIDHLQLLELGPDKDEYNTLRRITKSIKNYALRNNTPFIVLSQFSRPAKDKVFKEPTGHDLRSSGTISQDSDNILLLYKDPNTSDANELILKIDKWRSMVDRPPVYFTYTTGFKNNIPHVFRKSKEEINYKVTAKENKSPSQQDINSFFDPVAGF